MTPLREVNLRLWGARSPLNIIKYLSSSYFHIFFPSNGGPGPAVMPSRLMSSRSFSNTKALRQALAFSQALIEELKLITSGRVMEVDVLGRKVLELWGLICGNL